MTNLSANYSNLIGRNITRKDDGAKFTIIRVVGLCGSPFAVCQRVDGVVEGGLCGFDVTSPARKNVWTVHRSYHAAAPRLRAENGIA